MIRDEARENTNEEESPTHLFLFTRPEGTRSETNRAAG